MLLSCHLGLCMVAHCLVLFGCQLTRVGQIDAVVDQRLRRDLANVYITWVANNLGRVQLGGWMLCRRLSSRIVRILRPGSAIVMELGLANLKFKGRWSFSFLGHIVFQRFNLINLDFNTVKQILLLLVQYWQFILKLLIPLRYFLSLTIALQQLLLIALVVIENSLGVLVLSLKLLDEALNFLWLWVELVLHVWEKNIQIYRIFVLFDGFRTGARSASLLIQKLLLLSFCAFFAPSFFEHFEEAISFKLLLDHILQYLNVVPLLFIS